MALAKLLGDFDTGVEEARAEYEAALAGRKPIAFGKEFAAFAFYDTEAAGSSEAKLWKRLDGKQKKEPLLWHHIHQPLAKLLREDEDIGRFYAGFATLFTVDWSLGADRPQYPSMAIDVPLSEPGFRNLELSKWQFSDDPSRPLVLTDVCLNKAGSREFKPKPIIFHWRSESPDGQPADRWGVAPNCLDSWAHVFVTAKIPGDDESGLKLKLDWNRSFSNVSVVADNEKSLSREQLFRRLARASGGSAEDLKDPGYVRRLQNRFAWTVTYFAYGCGKFKREALDHLSIVCVPASFAGKVSSALYVPLRCPPTSPDFARAARKILYQARAVGMPLWKIHELSAARKEAELEGIESMIDAMSHELSKQTTVLFSNRLRRLSDMFVVNELSRSNDPRDLNDWATPAGTVSVIPSFEHEVAEWLVCPVPKLLDAIRNYLTIWGGSPGSLAFVGVKSDSVRGFVQAAVEVAIGGRLAEMMKDYSPKSLDKCKAVLEVANAQREALPKVLIRETGMPARLADPKEQVVLIRLFRVIAAAVANALEHSLPNKEVEVTIDTNETRIEITVLNYRADMGTRKSHPDGTRQVISSCLRGIMRETSEIKYDPDPTDANRWITQFECPRRGAYRDTIFQLFSLQDPR